MTEFYKGSVPCVVGQTSYQVIHPKINDPLSFPLVSMMVPSPAATPILIKGIANKSTVSFDVILDMAPATSGYAINWQVNIPGTDVAEYVNDKRYYSKEEIGNAKLARVHWKNVISAPDMTADGLQKNHNHDNRYFTKSEIVPVIDSRITDVGSYGPLANTLMLRDEHGRSQINSPKVNADGANKGYVDVKVAGEASARIAADLYLQSEITNISGSYATAAEATHLQNQITTLESLIQAISGTGFYSGGEVPVGTIICQASSLGLGLDYGYCDGGSLEVSAFQQLFDRIGYTFGGSGNYFNKPDMRAEFARGWDDGRGIDVGRVFGSSQSDDNKAHTHGASATFDGSHTHTASIATDGDHYHTFPLTLVSDTNTVGTDGPSTADDGTHVNQTENAGTHAHGITIDPNTNHSHAVTIGSVGTESRPRNIALKFFIKLYEPPMIEPVNITESQSISGTKTFTEPIIVAKLPQAIIFGDPLAIGTKALGIIGEQMVVTMHTSAGVWTPLTWLS